MEQTTQQAADSELMARISAGDQGAFRALYDRLSGPLYSLVCKMLGDVAEAQEVLQDVFVQIWRRAPTYDAGQSTVFTWAVLQTRSRTIDRLRARGRRARIVAGSLDEGEPMLPHASTAVTAADHVVMNDEASRVRTAFKTLPEDQREAIELAFFNDLTHHQIAEQLQQPLGTIKARIRRGLLKLREQMQTV
jgi:RNA polymerase sigma-70 factor (ECF subfamily)